MSDKKPWEEEWKTVPHGCGLDCGPDDDDSCAFYGSTAVAAPRAKLASAAPNMAQALQHADDALAARGYRPESVVRDVIRSALRKAGVIS